MTPSEVSTASHHVARAGIPANPALKPKLVPLTIVLGLPRQLLVKWQEKNTAVLHGGLKRMNKIGVMDGDKAARGPGVRRDEGMAWSGTQAVAFGSPGASIINSDYLDTRNCTHSLCLFAFVS